jgi:beta-glucanase (GH16 family)
MSIRPTIRLRHLVAITMVTAAVGFAGATANAAVPAATHAAPQAVVHPNTVPGAPAGFTTTWSDDFTGGSGSAIDGNWKFDTGTGVFGTGEIETMTNSTANVYQDGSSHLVLKALHSGTNPTSGWTSGRVETNAATFGAPAGGVVMMQASIQTPNLNTTNGAGYWPAFWMLGAGLRSGGTWPGVGEVDILEDINARSTVFGTLHCGVSPGGPCNESTGIGSGERACGGCQTAYHTYAVQIDRSVSPEQIRWYLDGANYFTINATQVDATTWSNAVDHPFFIILDLAMGGGFPAAFGGGPTASTVSGGQMNIDYVAVYNKAPGGGGGGGGTTTPIHGYGGKCVDVAGSNTANGTAIQLWTCNGTAAQNWTHVGNTFQALGKCMDVTSAGTANGTKVQLWDCNGTAAQQWTVGANNSLVNTGSGRCLDATGPSSADGTRLQIWDCAGSANQSWTLS